MGKISINLKTGGLEQKETFVGIDLGTTNSLIATMDNNGKPYIIGDNNNLLVPSVIHFTENNVPIVGSTAKSILAYKPKTTIASVKRLMGKSFKDISNMHFKLINSETEELVRLEINNTFYTPIELSALILKELKERAEKILNKKISKAVITVPAYFNDAQRQATKDAGLLAGIDVLRIINEPTAASLAYGLQNKNQNKTILVYDFGGGTFDVSILKIQNGIFEVLSTHGNTDLGGDDIDNAIIAYWQNKYSDYKNVINNTIKNIAEKAKIELCSGKLISTQFLDMLNIEVSLTEPELVSIIEPILSNTWQSVKIAMHLSNLEYNEIEEVVLVGGSTKIPIIKNKLQQIFPEAEINNQINPDEVVALGAAVEADILAGNTKDLLLLDVVPLSLGIETAGGLMDTIITRNTKIPAKIAKEYSTGVDGQINLKIAVFQGERELVKDNRKLGEFILKNIPAMPAGLPKIEVVFWVNADGILKVTAKELRSNTEQEIEIKPQYGLTDSLLEEMIEAGLKNAQTDIEERMKIEAITQAEQIVYTTNNFIAKNANLLSEQELNKTKEYLNHLSVTIESRNRDAILKSMDTLNDFTEPFAERLMDIAVAAALKGKKI